MCQWAKILKYIDLNGFAKEDTKILDSWSATQWNQNVYSAICSSLFVSYVSFGCGHHDSRDEIQPLLAGECTATIQNLIPSVWGVSEIFAVGLFRDFFSLQRKYFLIYNCTLLPQSIGTGEPFPGLWKGTLSGVLLPGNAQLHHQAQREQLHASNLFRKLLLALAAGASPWWWPIIYFFFSYITWASNELPAVSTSSPHFNMPAPS